MIKSILMFFVYMIALTLVACALIVGVFWLVFWLFGIWVSK